MFKRYAKWIGGVVTAAVLLVVAVSYMSHPKRYAVFAGYNPDGTLHSYVITYLKGLNEVADGVVYVADSTLKPEEEEKLKNLTIHYENVRHEEYDWGSYKRGFNWLKDNGYLKKADEVIFANDSCYAPLVSFKPMFDEMAKRKDLDFWGDLQNSVFRQHVQSYFFVFRKKIISSPEFDAFLNSVKHQEKYLHYVLKYETKLTPMFEKLGYKWDTYIPFEVSALLLDPNKTTYPLTLIKKYNHQFIKRRLFATKRILPSHDDLYLLLRYIHRIYPERYKEIITDIPEMFIPKDLRGADVYEPTYLNSSYKEGEGKHANE